MQVLLYGVLLVGYNAAMSSKIRIGVANEVAARCIQQKRTAEDIPYRLLAKMSGVPYKRIYNALTLQQAMRFDDFTALCVALGLDASKIVALAESRLAGSEQGAWTPGTRDPNQADYITAADQVAGETNEDIELEALTEIDGA